jgi:hypothetical protein
MEVKIFFGANPGLNEAYIGLLVAATRVPPGHRKSYRELVTWVGCNHVAYCEPCFNFFFFLSLSKYYSEWLLFTVVFKLFTIF